LEEAGVGAARRKTSQMAAAVTDASNDHCALVSMLKEVSWK
jgi:hypothetical protein